MLSVLPKELEYKVETRKYEKLEVMQPRINNRSELPVVEYTTLDQFTWSLKWRLIRERGGGLKERGGY